MQVAVSMKEPTVGRHIREEDILYVDVPESHVKLLRSEYQNILSRDEIECLNEFVEIKRKTAPYFAFGT
jgi:translation initiation factor 5B